MLRMESGDKLACSSGQLKPQLAISVLDFLRSAIDKSMGKLTAHEQSNICNDDGLVSDWQEPDQDDPIRRTLNSILGIRSASRNLSDFAMINDADGDQRRHRCKLSGKVSALDCSFTTNADEDASDFDHQQTESGANPTELLVASKLLEPAHNSARIIRISTPSKRSPSELNEQHISSSGARGFLPTSRSLDPISVGSTEAKVCSRLEEARAEANCLHEPLNSKRKPTCDTTANEPFFSAQKQQQAKCNSLGPSDCCKAEPLSDKKQTLAKSRASSGSNSQAQFDSVCCCDRCCCCELTVYDLPLCSRATCSKSQSQSQRRNLAHNHQYKRNRDPQRRERERERCNSARRHQTQPNPNTTNCTASDANCQLARGPKMMQHEDSAATNQTTHTAHTTHTTHTTQTTQTTGNLSEQNTKI